MIGGRPESVSHPAGSGTVLGFALAYYLLGCCLLVIGGVSLAALHAFAAFITLAIVAASNQLIPVLTGVAPKPASHVMLVSAPFALGFALLMLGFAGLRTFVPAAVLLGLGAFAWLAWIVVRLVGATLEKPMAMIFVLAGAAFAAAAVLGGGMAVGLADPRYAAFVAFAPAHAALALGAFATTMIVAISYRFVPMFSLSHAPVRDVEKLPQWIVPLVAIAACVCFVQLGLVPLRVAAGVIFCALLFAAVTHLRTLRSRMRRRLDASMRYAALAWAFGLTGAALLALAGWSPDMSVAALTCGVLGWIALSILGYAYKIVGFLAWETAKTRAPDVQLPPLSKALPERTTDVALGLLGIGTALIAALSLTSSSIVIGAVIYLCGALTAGAALLTLATTYLRIPRVAHAPR